MQVFISHSNAQSDRDFAKALAERLVTEGYQVWSDAQMLPGDNWPLQIGQALEHSKAMVVLLSPDAVQSHWVRHQIEYALGSEKYAQRVIPVLLRDSPDIPWILLKLNIIQEKNREQALERITQALSRVEPPRKPRTARTR
jgi:hypothetical protein